MMSDDQRIRTSAEISELMLHLVGVFMTDRGDPRDEANVGVSAGIATAVALIMRRGIDAAATVALVTCLAEGLAREWKGNKA